MIVVVGVTETVAITIAVELAVIWFVYFGIFLLLGYLPEIYLLFIGLHFHSFFSQFSYWVGCNAQVGSRKK